MKVSQFTPFLFILVVNISETFSAKILFVHILASYSHRVQTFPIAEALSKAGHDVSYIAPFKGKEPNPKISELVPKSLAEKIDQYINGEFDISVRAVKKMRPMHEFFLGMALQTCGILLSSPEFKEWEGNNKKFDLVIIDSSLAECGLGLAHHLGAKSIIFSTVVPLPYEYDAIGFLPQSASIPEMRIYSPPLPLSFYDRIWNTYQTLIWRVKHYLYTFKMDELLKKFLPGDIPHVGDLLRNTSLVFYTGDVISDYPRSLPPMFVNVAGTHCRESKDPLPAEMEKFISSTKNDGFIYISLGSVVVPGNMPEKIRNVFMETIKALPNLKFLWKWKGEVPKEIPDNLYLATWFPQVDVLSHGKIKGFVTQGGRPSTLEALYAGVPMINFPVLGDQDLNANRLSEMEATIKLEIATVTTEELTSAVQKVAYDFGFKKRMTRYKRIFRDRPMSPVDTAVWWVEYVLKYQDISHLRTAGADQYWFVRRQVDVWAFASISIFIILIFIFAILSKVLGFCCGRKQDSKKVKEN